MLGVRLGSPVAADYLSLSGTFLNSSRWDAMLGCGTGNRPVSDAQIWLLSVCFWLGF